MTRRDERGVADDGDLETLEDEGLEASSDGGQSRTRWPAIGGFLVAVAIVTFVMSVVRSTPSASVPVGASDAMPGMAMKAKRLSLTMRDIADRPVRIPGRGASIVVAAEARQCRPCVTAVRQARDAVRQARPRAQLIVVMLDASTGRGDVEAFAQSIGSGPMRYVIDDRAGALASMLGVSSLADAVVYDARGRAVAHPSPVVREMAAALGQAAG